jgi:hypothetical protein
VVLAVLPVLGGLVLSSAVWASTKNRNKPGLGLLPAAAFMLVAPPLLWWFLVHLTDTKTPQQPADFEFTKELGQGIASCANASENTLVIRLTFCGISDETTQEKILADVRSRNSYNGEKPIIMTFRTNVERHEKASGAGATVVWFTGGAVTREEMLLRQTAASEDKGR